MRRRIAPLAVVASIVIAGCGDSDTLKNGGSQTAAGEESVATGTTRTPADYATIGDGEYVTDGNLSFRVTKLRRVTKTIGAGGVAPIAPAKGEALVDVTFEVFNMGNATAKPFCIGSGGRVLLDSQDLNYQPEDDSMYLGDDCAAVPPGGTRSYRQVYRVTKDATGFSMAFWDPDEPGDYEGATYVVARAAG